jgi:UDP-glucose 4-epimerase
MTKQRASVVGGAGFIGSNLCAELKKRGYDVVSIDNNYIDRLCEQTRQDIEAHHLDILGSWEELYQAIEGSDVVYHLAVVCLPETFEKPHYSLDVATKGTLNVIKAAHEAKAFFIYCSSSEVYGELPSKQFEFTETDSFRPTTIYGAAKAAGELVTKAYVNLHYLRDGYLILRPFNCYGPGSREDKYATVVTNFVKNLLEEKPCIIHGDGSQQRDWMYVADTVDAMIYAYEHNFRLALQPEMNICTGHATSINDLFSMVCRAIGVNPPPGSLQYDEERQGDAQRIVGGTWYAATQLGWRASVPLNTGLKLYVKWMREKLGK